MQSVARTFKMIVTVLLYVITFSMFAVSKEDLAEANRGTYRRR